MVSVDPETNQQGNVDGLGLVKTLFKVGNTGGTKGRLPSSSTW